MTADKTAEFRKTANAALAEWRTNIESLRARVQDVRLIRGDAVAERIGRLNDGMAQIEQELCSLDGQSAGSLETTERRIDESFEELERRFRELEEMLTA